MSSVAILGWLLWRNVVGMHVLGEILVIEADPAFAMGIAGKGGTFAIGLRSGIGRIVELGAPGVFDRLGRSASGGGLGDALGAIGRGRSLAACVRGDGAVVDRARGGAIVESAARGGARWLDRLGVFAFGVELV